MEICKKGSRGETVKQIQKALHLIPDGIYGEITTEAVRAFQKKNGLTADGIVGPATFALLIPLRWKKSKRRITEIIVHCTATSDGRDFTVEDIRRWHKQRGFSDIGYHYVIYRDGSVHNGRDVDLIGAHCEGHNSHSIGVCYVGGLDADGRKPKDTRTPTQRIALVQLLRDLMIYYPGARIYGHRDFACKDCPCFDAKREYANI